jgi:hypothetical protein
MESKFYIISEIIKNRLKELLPQFSPSGIDNKLFVTSVEDFINYLKFLWDGKLRDSQASANIDSTDEPLTGRDLHEVFMEWLESCPEATKEEIDAWVSLWLCKWKARVQILFGEENIHNRNFNQMQDVIKKHDPMGFQEEKMYREPVIFTLISNSEIVGTEILAKVIINKAYSKLKSRPREVREKLQFLNECMREAKDMSTVSGKRIFISVKNFKWSVST